MGHTKYHCTYLIGESVISCQLLRRRLHLKTCNKKLGIPSIAGQYSPQPQVKAMGEGVAL